MLKISHSLNYTLAFFSQMNKNLPGIGILSDLMIQLDWMLKYSIIDAATWTIKTKNV